MYNIIKSIWQDSRKTYGAVRIHKKLRKLGLEVNIKRVRRLMKENQIKSIIHKKFRNHNKSDDMKETAGNILKRNFDTEKLNEKWVSDITYIWTGKDGWCYLSSIMDLHSRRIISHKVGKFMDIKLVIDTLKMAIYKRGDITDLIIHTDRGSQYMSFGGHSISFLSNSPILVLLSIISKFLALISLFLFIFICNKISRISS